MNRVITFVLLAIFLAPCAAAGFVFEVIADTFKFGRRAAKAALDDFAEAWVK